MSPFTRMPMWSRICAGLLLVSFAGGQVWQRQPAGDGTRLLLKIVGRRCPAAVRQIGHPSIADGARALDRWSLLVLADLVDRGIVGRCKAATPKGTRGLGKQVKPGR